MLLADANPLDNADFLVALAGLVGALLLGGVVLLWLDRWRKKKAAADAAPSADALSGYRAMYDKGELSKAEYQAIRGRLADQMRDEIEAAQAARQAKKDRDRDRLRKRIAPDTDV